MSDLFEAMTISSYGMRAQGTRMRVISENMANANTAAPTPEEDPYTRKVVTFKNELDREIGVNKVQVDKVEQETKEPYPLKFMPDHPGANEQGYVRLPNVNPLIEAMDMREAQRTYEANLGMIEQSRTMMMQTIDLLR
ncbi:MAG: flagellar basal body rod protein FlgC [Alphaproteobacteria bacterium]|jgi:flagellar basal-body rod protein FlgC|nr:flagellar basal body rod protein FlgC [Alphaproteobacteria bacterium]MDP7223027.1 flagellar basal body rod protein FlgC [Alphaproteobacteria bacterium]